jgi:large subunit ribosomal protein L31
MRKGIHPHYGSVVFRDKSANAVFLSASTMSNEETIEQFNRRYGVSS